MSYGSYQKIECLDCPFHLTANNNQEEVIRIAKEHMKNHPNHHVTEQTIWTGGDWDDLRPKPTSPHLVYIPHVKKHKIYIWMDKKDFVELTKKYKVEKI